MESILNEKKAFGPGLKRRVIWFDLVCYAFIVLFVYTAGSKLMTHDRFVTMLGKSPLLEHYNVLVSWIVPVSELVISVLLLIERTKKLGMWLSLAMMVVFTVYLVYMVSLDVALPCLCGGVVEMLSWKQHIFFNLFFIVLAGSALAAARTIKIIRA